MALPNNLVITDDEVRRVVKIVERVMDEMYDDVITQSLKNAIAVRDLDTRNEVTVSKSGKRGKDVTVSMNMASDSLKNNLMERLDYVEPGETHQEAMGATQREIDRSLSNKSSGGESGGVNGNEFVEANRDGSITFMPQYTKDSALYNPPRENTSDSMCMDCAHFIEGGGCHIVRGEIDESAVCKAFYADVGVFHSNRDDVGLQNPLFMWGEKYRWTMEEVDNFIGHIKDRLREKSK